MPWNQNQLDDIIEIPACTVVAVMEKDPWVRRKYEYIWKKRGPSIVPQAVYGDFYLPCLDEGNKNNQLLKQSSPEWLDKAYAGGSEETCSEVLIQMISELKNLMVNNKFSEIDETFSIIKIKDISPESIVGVLRITYSVKSKLYKWYPFLRNASNEFKRRKMNADELLIGLE